jgi:outer membrane protein TolC
MFFIAALALLGSSLCFATPRFLSENDLIKVSHGVVPKMEEIRSALLASETQKSMVDEKYAPEIFAKASYLETQENPIIEFLPIFSPVKTAQIGIRKKFSKGFDVQLASTTDQRSASSGVAGTYRDVTTTVVALTLHIDLWKDLFGRVSQAENRNAELNTQKAKLENEIRSKVFEISLRRIYWSLVATEEQIKISERLRATANQQLQDSQARLRNSIGDEGEVARYEAQLATRSGHIIYLTYQKENLLRQIKSLLPELINEDIQLSPYSIDDTIKEVMACSQVIMRENQTPYEFTKYDELVALLQEVKSNQREINGRYSDMNVKLFGSARSTGIGSNKLGSQSYRGNYGDAYNDMTGYNRTGYEAGLNVVIPLGDARSNTQQTKALYDEKRLQAQIESSRSQVASTHIQLAKSMGLIQEVIATQRINTSALERRLKVVRQKYSQARISVSDLIQDQDALLNSEISTIDSQLQAMNVLLDYLTVFTETPCTFNRR